MIVKDYPVDFVPIPKMVRVKREMNHPVIRDIRKTLHDSLEKIRARDKIRPGMKIAITAGSRGIAGIVETLRYTAEAVREWGAEPFVLSAMGSHGGGTVEGQKDIMAEYGITEKSVNAPLVCGLDVVEIGKTEHGIPVLFDKIAMESDGIIAVNRIKPHTDFRAPTESGLLKILAIGLGRVKGATELHRLGVFGMREVVPAAGRIILKKAPVLFGVGIVENASHQVAILEAIDAKGMEEREIELLKKAWEYYPRLPFDAFDVLILDWMGKDVSGAGIDPNVVGRMMIQGEKEFEKPRINRIAVLDITPGSHGNCVGIGLADIVTKRLYDKIWYKAYHVNVLTATIIDRAKIPLVAETDKAAVQMAIYTCWAVNPLRPKIVHLKNTLEVQDFAVSMPLLEDTDVPLEKTGDPYTMAFDAEGGLIAMNGAAAVDRHVSA